ncbi:MAG: 50S ribosomal protein L25/general stress protein Ctc [Micavibrio aeruginosavorus]|uniref:Large ribosomal subunit protein bL25 n=1 Tax=Micavibrio aeruginosavorus TaxID=349221 RepID=A0A7T5UHL5_9BACT|nr:MAG: 50S ribosomal protein L25/general stress protein Ctc [Micavibrio aeruginosavorus]
MSKQYAVKAEKRERAGKGIARALRREGKLPGVIYGDSKTPVLIAFSANDIQKEWQKGHMFTHLCELNVDGEKNLVLARDVQLHPVTDLVEHVDFLRVSPKTTLHVNVPVHFINHENSPGIKEKGVLTIAHHSLDMICRATEIPESIEVDLTPFKVNDTITISHVKLPAGAKMADDNPDFALASIIPPKSSGAEEAAPAAAAAAAAPAAGAKTAAAATATAAKAPAAKK